jgi:dihydrofolate reductase
MSNIVYIATSLDGYIARKDGNLDWLNEIPKVELNDFGFTAFMNRIDAIIMGRNTFETVVSFNEWVYIKPVFVLSRTLNAMPKEYIGKAEIIKGNLNEIIEGLNKRGFNDLYIDGGKTIQGFLEEDLIDELIITRVPIILGSGIPLFGQMKTEILFYHVKTESYKNGLVISQYKRK